MRKSELLNQLSAHLDTGRLLADNPGLDKETLSSLLKEAADALGPSLVLMPEKAEGAPAKGPGGLMKVYTDGASRGNPGEAGAGVVIKDESGKVVKKVARYLGRTTNNQAEYSALILGLEAAAEAGASEVHVLADSELLVKQMRGEYQVKNAGIKDKFAIAKRLLENFKRARFEHIPREKNFEADALANEAIDKRW